jgi:hypothetical protein
MGTARGEVLAGTPTHRNVGAAVGEGLKRRIANCRVKGAINVGSERVTADGGVLVADGIFT